MGLPAHEDYFAPPSSGAAKHAPRDGFLDEERTRLRAIVREEVWKKSLFYVFMFSLLDVVLSFQHVHLSFVISLSIAFVSASSFLRLSISSTVSCCCLVVL